MGEDRDVGHHRFVTTPQATEAWGSGLVAGILWVVQGQSASGTHLSILGTFPVTDWSPLGIAGRRKQWVGSKSARAWAQDASMTFCPGAQTA